MSKVDAKLVTILSWPRPHGSPAELAFREWLKADITKIAHAPSVMVEGCLFIHIGESTVLFSSHIDTIDSPAHGALVDGKVPLKSLTYDPNMGIIGLASDSKFGTCLGADDGAGVWLMLQMIRSKVPGGYIFHTGEERGGIGSRAVLQNARRLLASYEIAVAFDRPHETEIVTHQGGLECASDKCGTALAKTLNEHGFSYELSREGVFTDTKVYRGVIAECFNLGVGYDSQHGVSETQNYEHLEKMATALTKLAWGSLPVDRDPTKPDPQFSYKAMLGSKPLPKEYDQGGYPFPGNFRGLDDGSDFHRGYPRQSPQTLEEAFFKAGKPKPTKKRKAVDTVQPTAFAELSQMTQADMLTYLLDAPESATAAMRELILEIGRLRSDVSLLTRMLGN